MSTHYYTHNLTYFTIPTKRKKEKEKKKPYRDRFGTGEIQFVLRYTERQALGSFLVTGSCLDGASQAAFTEFEMTSDKGVDNLAVWYGY